MELEIVLRFHFLVGILILGFPSWLHMYVLNISSSTGNAILLNLSIVKFGGSARLCKKHKGWYMSIIPSLVSNK